MHLATLLTALSAALALAPSARAVAPSPASATVWQPWQTALEAARPREDPLSVTVRAELAGPRGERIRAVGFWDGGRTYLVRCAFPAPGAWRWRTECSDAADTGLHGRSGTVRVAAYRGSNPLFRHGFLRVSDNRRYLCHADGTPFFWLGDTAWAAPLKARDADWDLYLRRRRAQGFTVIQVGIAPEWAGKVDAAGEKPFVGEGIRAPNPPFWRSFEDRVRRANAAGFPVLVVGVMEPTTRYPAEPDAVRFARYLAARLCGSAVMLSPSFDSPYMPVADAVGRALRETVIAQLVTQHPGTPGGQPTAIWSEEYFDRPYLDFVGVQSGHNGGNRERCASQAVNWVLHLYRREPHRPVVNLEAMYDGQGVNAWTADDARRLAWLSLLSGAAGYTYGAGEMRRGMAGDGGVWGWVTDPAAPDYWRKALEWPSAAQMGVVRRVLTGVDWWDLEPAPERVLSDERSAQRRPVIAVARGGRLAVAYLPAGGRARLDLDGMTGPLQARWIDPSTGAERAGGRVEAERGATLRAPGSRDRVLVLRAARSAGRGNER